MSLDINALILDFRNRFDEFSNIIDAKVAVYLDDALAIHKYSDRAVLYLAAHLCALDQSFTPGSVDGGLGVVTSQKTGKKQDTFKTQSERDADSFFETTHYGRKYLEFRRSSPGGKFRVRVYG